MFSSLSLSLSVAHRECNRRRFTPAKARHFKNTPVPKNTLRVCDKRVLIKKGGGVVRFFTLDTSFANAHFYFQPSVVGILFFFVYSKPWEREKKTLDDELWASPRGRRNKSGISRGRQSGDSNFIKERYSGGKKKGKFQYQSFFRVRAFELTSPPDLRKESSKIL